MSRLNKKRKKQPKRSENKTILIVCEGNSEINYFKQFRPEGFRIQAGPDNNRNTDVLKLVKHALEMIKSNEFDYDYQYGDRVYCVFDALDEQNTNNKINKAKKLAKEIDIILIPSNPCFELWILLHCKYTTAPLNADECITQLIKELPNYKKGCAIYLHEIFNDIGTAIKRAKKLEQFHLNNIIKNPSTDIYKIIEYIFNK